MTTRVILLLLALYLPLAQAEPCENGLAGRLESLTGYEAIEENVVRRFDHGGREVILIENSALTKPEFVAAVKALRDTNPEMALALEKAPPQLSSEPSREPDINLSRKIKDPVPNYGDRIFKAVLFGGVGAVVLITRIALNLYYDFPAISIDDIAHPMVALFVPLGMGFGLRGQYERGRAHQMRIDSARAETVAFLETHPARVVIVIAPHMVLDAIEYELAEELDADEVFEEIVEIEEQ